MLKATAVLFKIQGKVIIPCTLLPVVEEIFVHEKCSDKIFCPSETVNQHLLVIKVIISYNNSIAIDPMKRIGTQFSFSDFHGQKFSWQQEPGLMEKITENMINISIFN